MLRKGAIANADFVVTDSADLGETRHGPAISLNYVEVTTLARDDLMSILVAFPETAKSVARAALFYKARAAVLRWASRQNDCLLRRCEKPFFAKRGAGGGAHTEQAALNKARRHSGVVRPLSTPSSRIARGSVVIGSRDPRLARSMDQTPIINKALPYPPPPRSLSTLSEDGVGAGMTGSAAELSTAPQPPSNSGTDGASGDPSLAFANDRQLGALRDQMSALEATCAVRFGSLEATCAERFGSIEALLRRLDRRMGQTSYDNCERRADASEMRQINF